MQDILLITTVNAFSNVLLFYVHIIPITLGSGFATVRFTTIHFYDPCRVGPSTPDCRNSSVLSVLSALVALFLCACVSSFSIFRAVL